MPRWSLLGNLAAGTLAGGLVACSADSAADPAPSMSDLGNMNGGAGTPAPGAGATANGAGAGSNVPSASSAGNGSGGADNGPMNVGTSANSMGGAPGVAATGQMGGAGAASPAGGAVDMGVGGSELAPSGGASASAGGAGVDGMDGQPERMIAESGSEVHLELGGLRMVVDSADGGKIVEFSLNGANVIVGQSASSSGYDYGSTFWPAPQEDWEGGWPPPPSIDAGQYSVDVTDTAATLTSVPEFGIVVTKQFSFAAAGDGIDVTYAMTADGATQNYAPWEITRVAGGTTFFAPGGGARVVDNLSGVSDTVAGHVWYTYPGAGTPVDGSGNPKLSADGSGWIANADPTSNLLLVKSFADTANADFPPGQGEVEIYGSPDSSYVEVENTGPYAAIGTASVAWTVTWRLVEIPAGTEIADGSQGLVDLAAAALGN